MNFNEYQAEAVKTMKEMSFDDANTYFALKINEEANELTSIFTKHKFHGKPLDKEKLIEEAGDLLWFIANFCQRNGFSLEESCIYNIEKLRKRHGDKYNKEFYAK